MTIPTTATARAGVLGVAAAWLSELRGNRRALAGLLLILVIVAGDGFVLLRSATAEKHAEHARELTRLQRVIAVGQEHDWPRRAAASRALRAQLEGRLWTADSDGIARADLQDWLTTVARDVGLSTIEVRIELAAPKSLPPDMRQVTATITAQPDEPALIKLLDRIAQAPHVAVVERLSVKQRPSPYLEMVLTAYARIGAKKADPAPPPLTPDRRNPL